MDHAAELERAEEAILKTLEEETTYSPRQLIEQVRNSHGDSLPEEAISVALWNLIGRAEVKLTSDWRLDAHEASNHSLTSSAS